VQFIQNPFGPYQILGSRFGHDAEVGQSPFDHEVANLFGPPDVGEEVGIPDFEQLFVFGIVQQGDLFDHIFGTPASPPFVHLVVGAKGAAPGAAAGGVDGVDGVGIAFFAVTAGAEGAQRKADGVDILDVGAWFGVDNGTILPVGKSLDRS